MPLVAAVVESVAWVPGCGRENGAPDSRTHGLTGTMPRICVSVWAKSVYLYTTGSDASESESAVDPAADD